MAAKPVPVSNRSLAAFAGLLVLFNVAVTLAAVAVSRAAPHATAGAADASVVPDHEPLAVSAEQEPVLATSLPPGDDPSPAPAEPSPAAESPPTEPQPSLPTESPPSPPEAQGPPAEPGPTPAAGEAEHRPTAPTIRPPPAPRWTPEQLQASLLQVPEVGLQHAADRAVARTGRAGGRVHPVLAVIDARPDLRGLPVRRGPDVQLPPPEAEAFRDASVLLRQELGELTGQDPRRGDPARARRLAFRPEVYTARPQVVARVLHQMIQVESAPLRTALVRKMSQLRHPTAARALAHRAVYEPRAELRQAAVKALAGRPPADYLPALLDAFRSPWPPAADHAADALAALAPADALPGLVALLDAPDPAAPAPDDRGVPTVRELVRVNHARNCLLCHAESVARRDGGIRVAVPSPVRPLPSPFSLDAYEGGGRGGARVPRDTVFARPDITYLQQDFSWVLPVATPGPWPAAQRFDFVVRTRPAEPGEVAATDRPADFPQRQAVCRALVALTGQDFGDRAEDWRTGLALAAAGGP